MTTGSSTCLEGSSQVEQMAVENIKTITEIEISEINDDEDVDSLTPALCIFSAFKKVILDNVDEEDNMYVTWGRNSG